MTGTGSERGANVLDSQRAAELGKASGRARRKLTLADVEAALPPMDSPEHVRAGLQLVQRWAAGGLLAGSVAGACVRAAEAWLKLHEYEVRLARMRDLEAKIKRLEAERRAAVRTP